MIVNLISDKSAEMPMLESIMNKFADLLQHQWSLYIEDLVKIDSVSISKEDSVYTTDYLSVDYSFAGYNAEHFNVYIQNTLLHKMLEVALGGRHFDSQAENEGFSKVEEKIIENIIHILSESLQKAFSVTEPHVTISQENINYDDYTTDKKIDACIATFLVDMQSISSHIKIILPYVSLLPIKGSLMKHFSNKLLVRQDAWKRHMKEFILDMHLPITVEVESTQTFKDILEAKAGDTIIIDKAANEAFAVKVNGMQVYDCKIGRIDDKIAVEIING